MRYNRNYGKFLDGQLAYAPNPLVVDGVDTFPLDAPGYLAEGYKPIVRTPMPEPVEGYQWVSAWAETDIAITLTWTREALPPPEPDPNEIIDIITGEVE